MLKKSILILVFISLSFILSACSLFGFVAYDRDSEEQIESEVANVTTTDEQPTNKLTSEPTEEQNIATSLPSEDITASEEDSSQPANTSSLNLGARIFTTNVHTGRVKNDIYTIVRSVEELKAYIVQYEGVFDFTRKDAEGYNVYSLMEIYGEEFFAIQDLVIIGIERGTQSINYAVNGVIFNSEANTLEVEIRQEVPEIGVTAMGGWHIVIPVEKLPADANLSVMLKSIKVD